MSTLIKPPCTNGRRIPLCYPGLNSAVTNSTVNGGNGPITAYCICPNDRPQWKKADKYVVITASGSRVFYTEQHLIEAMKTHKLQVVNLVLANNNTKVNFVPHGSSYVYDGDMQNKAINFNFGRTEKGPNEADLMTDFKNGLNKSKYIRSLKARFKLSSSTTTDATNLDLLLFEELCTDFNKLVDSVDIQAGIVTLHCEENRNANDKVSITLKVAKVKNSDKFILFVEDRDRDGGCGTNYFYATYSAIRSVIENNEYFLAEEALSYEVNMRDC